MSNRHLVAIGVLTAMTLGVQAGAQAPSPVAPTAQTASAAPAAPAGNAANGRKLFVSFGCYQCHGYEAQGSTATGPRLGPRPIAFAAFSKYVRRPTNQMPPFTAKVVTDRRPRFLFASAAPTAAGAP